MDYVDVVFAHRADKTGEFVRLTVLYVDSFVSDAVPMASVSERPITENANDLDRKRLLGHSIMSSRRER
jgi:hypothetical protein